MLGYKTVPKTFLKLQPTIEGICDTTFVNYYEHTYRQTDRQN